jgi:ABC-type nitrate/sulfonate/bicarbonate transport system substrate-binding protein
MDIVAYFAKESWVKANPDVALRFKRAIDRATTDVATMSKEERDNWVAKYTGMKLDVVKNVTLPFFTTQYNIPSLQANIELAAKYKMISKPFDVNTMIWKP